MNFTHILPSEMVAQISYSVGGKKTEHIYITSDNIINWKNYADDNNSNDLMFEYLENKFGIEEIEKFNSNNNLNNNTILKFNLPDTMSSKEKENFKDILCSFLKAEGFTIHTNKKSSKLDIFQYFNYLEAMSEEEALSSVEIQKSGDNMKYSEKVKKVEEIIFSFSDSFLTQAQIDSKIQQIQNLNVNFDDINPAKRDENRHPRQWFLDLINCINLRIKYVDYDGVHGQIGPWNDNFVAMAVGLLPYIGDIPNLELDGKEYQPKFKKEKYFFVINKNKDLLDLLTEDIFTKYEQLPSQHFVTLFDAVMKNVQVDKEKATNLSYRIMKGDYHGHRGETSKFNDSQLKQAYTALIKAAPTFTLYDIGWRIENIKHCPETYITVKSLILAQKLDNDLEEHTTKKRKNKV